MNLLDDPVPFKEAIKALADRQVMPTSLDSAALRLLDGKTKRAAFFSATNNLSDVLDGIKDAVESIINPKQVTRLPTEPSEREAAARGVPGLTKEVTTGLDPASARLAIKKLLKDNGYSPESDIRGTIKDLSSDARINLVVRTNVELSQGAGAFIKQSTDADTVDLWPGLELVRFIPHVKQRDWEDRWQKAAEASGDEDAARVFADSGRMIARVDSPIWDSLGDSDLFPDALDNPFPPFAFNSGMWTMPVSRDECVEVGLIDDGDNVEPRELDIASLFDFGSN